MKVTEKALDREFDSALSDLKENLKEEPGGKDAGGISKSEVLQKAQKAVKEGKLDIITAGNIERRINKGVPLAKAHRAILGLADGAKIAGLQSPEQSSPAARMSGAPGKPGRPAAKVDLGTGSPAPVNSVVEAMAMGQQLTHSYQAPNGEIVTVTGAEILRKCQEFVRAGKLTLLKAGDVERAVNSGLPLRPEVLRFLFEV